MPDSAGTSPRRTPPLERVVTQPVPGAPLLLLLLLMATGAAAFALPAPVAVAPGVLAVVLAGLCAGVALRVAVAAVVPALLLVAPALADGGGLTAVPQRPELAAAAAVAVVLVVVAQLVFRCTHVASAAHREALHTALARQEDQRAAALAQQELTAQLQYWSSHDALTGRLNRSTFLRSVDATVAAGHPTAVLVVCVGGFGAVNTELGDAFGDAALVELGRRLVAVGPGQQVVGRLGGDAFAVLLAGVPEADARAFAAPFLEPLAQPFVLGDQTGVLRVRGGLAVLGPQAEVAGCALLRAAEAACARATIGQPPVVVLPGAPAAPAGESGLTEADLARGLQADELFLLYQPLVSGKTGCIASVEALVRWRHPEHGLVPPDAFIGLAERTGLIVPLGLKVLQQACAQLQLWGQHAPDLTVAVNVSARQLVEPGFVEDVQRVLWSSRVDPTRLVLELTESLLVDDSEAAVAVLWQLRGLGVRLALDDFGTGYSSLARLGEMPLDEMKIDKSFVDRLGAQPQDSATLVTAAVAMGHGLGLQVVAEGVETMAQAVFLREVDCDLLQGYLLGKPQPADEVTPQLGRALLPPPGAVPLPRTDGDTSVVVPGLLPPVGPPRR